MEIGPCTAAPVFPTVREYGAVTRGVGGLAVVLMLLAGCNEGNLPTTGPTATQTPVSTPAALDGPRVVLAGPAAFPPVPGGPSLGDCSFAGLPANSAPTDSPR